jgi:hypothetical protein
VGLEAVLPDFSPAGEQPVKPPKHKQRTSNKVLIVFKSKAVIIEKCLFAPTRPVDVVRAKRIFKRAKEQH